MSHPEDTCQKCERPNVWSWHAPSPLWNAVMRDENGHDLYSIVCPPCFAELAETKGVVPAERHTWHFTPEGIDIVSLWQDRDGRVYDNERCLWVDAKDASIATARRMVLRAQHDDGEHMGGAAQGCPLCEAITEAFLGTPDVRTPK